MSDEKWSHKLDYVLTVLGFALGVGTIWKFPYMCARNGGGSFLIPYVIFMVIGSIPLTYLECCVGQFSQLNCFDAWQICPSFRGLAIGSVLVSGIFFIYAPVLLAWILYYFYHSFSSVLPWTLCGQSWNTDNCLDNTQPVNITGFTANQTNVTGNLGNFSILNGSSRVPAAEEFFRNNMLQITDGLENMGEMRWPLTASLFAVFLCVYLCILNGIRISGKVVYVTVIAPYILVTVILVRACSLPGSVDGILYYITPDFGKLMDPKIWMEACGLAIYFMGIGFGSLIKMASHNPITNNCFRDAIVLNILTTASLVYFGFSVFAITGHLAFKRGVTMDSYSTSGFKLGFVIYPEATALLPVPQLWSVMLFLMLFTLGLDTMIPPAEYVASIVGTFIPRLKRRVWILNGIVVLLSFLMAVPYTMQGGVYLMTLVEWFAFFPSLTVFGFVELVVVGWIYGTRRAEEVIARATSGGLPMIMTIMWKFICPSLMLIVFGYSLYSYRPPRFEDFIYEPWTNVIGWLLSMTVVSPVPIYFIWSVWKAQGTTLTEKLKSSVTPRGPWEIARSDENEELDERSEFLSQSGIQKSIDLCHRLNMISNVTEA